MSDNRKYLILGVTLLILIVGFILVRGNDTSSEENTEHLDVSGNENSSPSPLFKLEDLREIDYSLAEYKGTPVLVHFMAVGCGGQYSKLNDNQLKQLKTICTSLCDEEKITIFTVLVSTCTSTDLLLLYDMYNITWILGNDYQDNKLDVVETYSEYKPEDGMVILLDKDLAVKEVIKESISADVLIDKILQLEG